MDKQLKDRKNKAMQKWLGFTVEKIMNASLKQFNIFLNDMGKADQLADYIL